MAYRTIAAGVLTLLVGGQAFAQLAITANDNHWTLENGVQVAVKNAPPDSISIIDLSANPPKLVTEIEGIPASVIGPPLCVAIAPDESIALVAASMKLDPADPTKQIEDNRVTVIDLKATPPRVIATLTAGKAPASVSINRQGNLALVANRGEGSVSVFTINGKTVTAAVKFQIPDANALSAAAHVAFAPDGRTAYLTRDGDHTINILSVEGTTVKLAGRDLKVGLRPYPMDIIPSGAVAVVANVGPGNGDTDTASVIDLAAKPARVVDYVAVGQTPEGIKLSPDGRLAAVVLQNGANKPKDSPFYNDYGLVALYSLNGTKLTKLAEARTGHWTQGVAFANDNRTIAVTNMVEKNVQIFTWDGTTLRETAKIQLKGAPASIRTAQK